MKVLVTGGSGKIGGFVLRDLLAHGFQPVNFGRSQSLVGGVPHVAGDITDLPRLCEVFPGYDAIVHLAAIPSPTITAPEIHMQVNVIGTFNVLEAAVRAKVGKVVFTSSGATLGFNYQRHPMHPKCLPIDEDHPCEPQDEYGLSKVLGELTCKRYSAAYGIRTICLRINSNWYLDRDGVELAVRSGWNKNRTVEEQWNDYRRRILNPSLAMKDQWAVTDARDTAQAFRLALEDEAVLHDVFFINADDTCSTLESADLVTRLYQSVPVRSPLIGHASLFSHEKATRLLGFRPEHSWRQGDFREWLDSLAPLPG